MGDYTVVLVATVCLLFSFYVISTLLQHIRDQRVEIQKLTAALTGLREPVGAAVYMSHDPKPARPTAEILEERAKHEADWRPLGL